MKFKKYYKIFCKKKIKLTANVELGKVGLKSISKLLAIDFMSFKKERTYLNGLIELLFWTIMYKVKSFSG